MDYIIAKIYELLIRLKRKNVEFKYFVLIERGFTEKIIKPNTMNWVTVYYELPAFLDSNSGSYKKHKTFKNIKEAYNYFK